MRLFTFLFCLGLALHLQAQSAQYTQVPLNNIDSNDGVPAAPTEMVRLGGSLFAIISEPSSSDAGRLWRSDDDGLTWTKLDLFPNEDNNFKLVQLHASGSTLLFFAIKQKTNSNSQYEQTITGYRSTDGGVTISEVFYYQQIGTFGSTYITLDGLDEANGHLFFFFSEETSSDSRLFISDDDGVNWAQTYPNWSKIYKISGENGRYYAMGEQVLFETDNPWFFNAYDNAWANGSGSTLLECAAFGNSLYFCNAKGQVISSPNGLGNPTQVQLPFSLSAALAYNGYWFFNHHGHFYRAPLQDPLNLSDAGFIPMQTYSSFPSYQSQGRFVADGSRLFWFYKTPLESTDGGLSWGLAPGAFPQRGGLLKKMNNRLWLYRDVWFRSDDGQNWELYRDATGLDEEDYQYYEMTELQGRLFLIQFDYYNSSQRKVLRSDDDGLSWTTIWQGIQRPALRFNTDNQRLMLILSPLENGYPASGLLYSDNFGDTWNTIPGASGFTTLAAKGDSVFYYANQKVFFTYNLGQQWQTTNINTTFQYGGTILAFPNGQVLLINNSTYIGYASLDGGQSFSEIFDLQNFGTHVYASYFENMDSLLIGSGSTGTFFSVNGGLNWIYFFEGPWTNCRNFAIHNGYFYAGASGNNNNSYEEPGLRTPLQPLLDQLNQVTVSGGVATGPVFYDLNGSCTQNFGEPGRTNKVFVFQPGNFAASSDLTGRVSRILPAGNYTMQYATPLYHDANCFNPPNLSITPGNQSLFTLGFKPNQLIKDLAVYLSGTALRPGWPLHLTLTVANLGTVAVPAGTPLTLNYPDYPFSYTDADPAPSSQSAGSVNFILPDLPPYTELTYKVDLQLPPDPSLAGQTFYISAGMNTNFSDPTAYNNSATWSAVVTNSFDPNDKTAYTSSPTGELPLKDKELRYLIRFQNTGTDTAFRVVVMDTLSPLLDWSTLQTLSTSHPYRLVLCDPGVASWRFDNILLPDSTTNEAASHGFVYFSIRAKDGVRIGDTLRNRAAIYFDFNDPVLTNETATRVVRRAIYRQNEVAALPSAFEAEIIPNPVGERLACRLNLSEPAILTVTLNDANGRILTILENKTPFDAGEHWLMRLTNELPAGSYWLNIQSETEQQNLPVVKQ